MKKSLFLAITTAAVALVWAGCQSPGGAYAPVNTTKGNYEMQANFVLLDPGAQRSVTSPGIQTRTLPDGRLEVAANIRNQENRRIEVQVNCVFKDAQGFEVDSTPFETLILTENSIETKRFVSMNDKAKNFTVRVREAR